MSLESNFNVFQKTQEFADRNFFIDVADKIPIFLCSIGGHLFNSMNKCSRCDFDPDSPLYTTGDFVIEHCPLRHNNMPFYTPMSQLPDTRIHLMLRGAKGSGKSILILMFLAENTGLVHSNNADMGQGYRTMMGANSITEADFDAPTAAKLLSANAVGSTEIANGAVTEAKLDAPTQAKLLSANAVDATHIAPNAVGASELANNAVDTAAIANDAVTSVKIAANAVTSAAVVADCDALKNFAADLANFPEFF